MFLAKPKGFTILPEPAELGAVASVIARLTLPPIVILSLTSNSAFNRVVKRSKPEVTIKLSSSR